LVLGQSQDRGWKATLSGAGSLGTSALIDGYANGWYVNPKGLPSTLNVSLHFAPQSVVWVALIASALAMLLCLALAILLARRRSRPSQDADGEHEAHEHEAHEHEAHEQEANRRDRVPTLRSPFKSSGSRPGLTTLVAAPLAAALVAAFVISPWAAVLSGLAVLVGLAIPSSRAVITLFAVALVALSGFYEIVQQYRYHYPPEFEWPTFFTIGNTLVWIAIALLVSDVLVEYGRRGRPTPPDRQSQRPTGDA
ncbi:MAG: hypothetical protein ACRD1G_16805, partial [Acidimicrobiales bacterium]